MIKITADGTSTIYSAKFDQHYHSIFGAQQESELVFMKLGLQYALEKFEEVNLFEMGFGTGLNALLASELAKSLKRKVNYTGIEAYPIDLTEAEKLNFDAYFLHELSWENRETINEYFSFLKLESRLEEIEIEQKFNLIFYDAFAPESQPELWTAEIFQKLASMLVSGGILTTYCSKGYVQRNMKTANFRIEKHQGPARKREVIRAILE